MLCKSVSGVVSWLVGRTSKLVSIMIIATLKSTSIKLANADESFGR